MQWIYLLCFLLHLIHDKIYTTSAECDVTEFPCSSGRCINMAWKCDGDDDCHDNSDENECQKQTCRDYRCRNSSQCIPNEWKCDGQPDCPKEEDETECNNTCDSVTEFQCQDKRCISVRWVCDHHEDCDDGSDEKKCATAADCTALGEKMCNDGECISEMWWCDGDADCKDKSDELNCTEKLTGQACGFTEFQCNMFHFGPQCIHRGWKCDGDKDCSDGSDETSCSGRTCSPEERMCGNNSCQRVEFFCDGEADCEDSEDESNCTYTVAPQGHCMSNEFDCGSDCISDEKICNGADDCGNGADEALDLHCPLKANNTCLMNNGGCNQLCIPNTSLESGRRCECKSGFNFISGSSTECEDVDECTISGTCSQTCTNTKGSYKCKCVTGYTLTNHRYCKANDGSHAELVLSDRHGLRRYNLDTYHYSLLLYQQVSGAVAMDFDIRNKKVFWTNVQFEKIYTANLTTGEIEVIIEDNIRMPDGLAVDWVHRNLYLADTGLDRIEVARLDGSSRKTLVDQHLDEPRALVVDPRYGWMYWTDWGGKPKIEKCGMNGQYRKEIVTKNILWPNGLTIDYVLQRLYWVDAKLHTIGSSDLEGNNYKQILRNHRNLGHPFAIAVFEDYLYWTDWMSNAVHRVSKFGHSNASTIVLDLKTPMDIHVYHIYTQPSSMNWCGENNGGCSHLCLPVPQMKTNSPVLEQSVCACPDFMILDGSSNCKQSGKAVTTKKLSQSNTDITSQNRPQIYKPGMQSTFTPADETTVKHVSNIQQATQDAAVNATLIEMTTKSVGVIAGIVMVILVATGLLSVMIIFMLLRRHKSRNVKSMNFDNPVYCKTTIEDQLILDKNGSRSSHPQVNYQMSGFKSKRKMLTTSELSMQLLNADSDVV